MLKDISPVKDREPFNCKQELSEDYILVKND